MTTSWLHPQDLYLFSCLYIFRLWNNPLFFRSGCFFCPWRSAKAFHDAIQADTEGSHNNYQFQIIVRNDGAASEYTTDNSNNDIDIDAEFILLVDHIFNFKWIMSCSHFSKMQNKITVRNSYPIQKTSDSLTIK